MGGAAAPDKTNYPSYLQNVHSSLLAGELYSATPASPYTTTSIIDAFNDAIAQGSPYAAITAYDPQSDLDTMQERLDEINSSLDAIDPDQLVSDWSTAAATAAGSVVTTAEIDAVVDAFEARSQGAYMRNVSRFAAGMFDIGAVMNTQFGMGLAQMELDRQDQVNDVDSRLRLLAERERFQTTGQYVGEISRLLMFKLQEQRASVGSQFDISRFSIQALQDQRGLDLGYEVNDATWNLELFSFPMQATNALSGAVQMYKQQTKGERLAASFMTAGSFGIQVGTAMGSPAAGFLAGGASLATQLLAGIS